MFFTNTSLPIVDGVDFAQAFKKLGVEVVKLPITFRLPPSRVASFGNQFYIFDILNWFAEHGSQDRLIVLDSDCVWRRSVDEMEAAIDTSGVLTYVLGEREYAAEASINGLSRAGMAQFLGRSEPVPYCGGEIFAGSRSEVRCLVAMVPAMWNRILAAEFDAPCEEAHFLSVLYADRGYAVGTANTFIQRMWTNFNHNTLSAHDRTLAIWHLPTEKKTGFHDLFRLIVRRNMDPNELDDRRVERMVGYPRRSLRKFIRDLSLKMFEKLRALTA